MLVKSTVYRLSSFIPDPEVRAGPPVLSPAALEVASPMLCAVEKPLLPHCEVAVGTVHRGSVLGKGLSLPTPAALPARAPVCRFPGL